MLRILGKPGSVVSMTSQVKVVGRFISLRCSDYHRPALRDKDERIVLTCKNPYPRLILNASVISSSMSSLIISPASSMVILARSFLDL